MPSGPLLLLILIHSRICLFFNDEGCEMFTVLIMRKSERMFKTSDDVYVIILNLI